MPKLPTGQRGSEQETRGREGLKFREQDPFLTRRNNLGGMGAEERSGTKETTLPVLPLNSQGLQISHFSDFICLQSDNSSGDLTSAALRIRLDELTHTSVPCMCSAFPFRCREPRGRAQDCLSLPSTGTNTLQRRASHSGPVFPATGKTKGEIHTDQLTGSNVCPWLPV